MDNVYDIDQLEYWQEQQKKDEKIIILMDIDTIRVIKEEESE